MHAAAGSGRRPSVAPPLPSMPPSSMAAPWGQLAGLRSTAVCDLLARSRREAGALWQAPSLTFQRALRAMSPESLATWCRGEAWHSGASSSPLLPLLLWLALMAIRSGLLTPRQIRTALPQLTDAAQHVEHATATAPQPSSTVKRHRTTDASSVSGSGGTQTGASVPSEEEGQLTASRPPTKRRRVGSTLSLSHTIDEAEDVEIDDGASLPADYEPSADTEADSADETDLTLTLPKHRQEYLAAKFLPPLPVYEADLPASVTDATAAPLPPLPAPPPVLPASSLAHLYFPSLFAAQWIAIGLQYNDSPSTSAAHHAFANIQAIPSEFRKPARLSSHTQPHPPHQLPHGQPSHLRQHSTSSTHFDSELPPFTRSNSQPHAQHPTPGARNYESPGGSHHAHQHTPVPHSSTSNMPFRPHLPGAAQLLHRPVERRPPTHAMIGAMFVIPTEEAHHLPQAPPRAPPLTPHELEMQRKLAHMQLAAVVAPSESTSASFGSLASSPTISWSDLPPPPFCFFPWTHFKSARLSVTSTHEKEDDESDESDSDKPDADQTKPVLLDTSPQDSKPHEIHLPAHLCRLLQQQALAPLAHFARLGNNRAPSRRSSGAWLTIASLTRSNEDHTEEGVQRIVKQCSVTDDRAAHLSSLDQSPDGVQINGSSPQAAPTPFVEPRLLVTFEDSPGHDELRAYPSFIGNWFDRAGVKPFNPTLLGAFDRASTPANNNLLQLSSSSGTTMHKHLLYLVVPPVTSFLDPAYSSLDTYFANLAATYENCNLGRQTNLLAHSAPFYLAYESNRPRSCVLDVRYGRPDWIRPLGDAAARASMTPSPSPSPLLHDEAHLSPMPSPNGVRIHAHSPHGTSHTLPTSKPSTSGQFPPLFDLNPPSHGAHRYYQGLVFSILNQLAGVVRNKEQAGSTSGSGALVPGSLPGSAGRTAMPLDFDRFDVLLVYISIAPDGPAGVHSLPMLSHYLSYLTEHGKLLAEIEHLQERYQPHYHHHHHPAGANSSALTTHPASANNPPSSSPPVEFEVLFSESDKDLWSSALQCLEHLHLCIHFVPTEESIALIPANLRSRALQVYTQVCRLSDKVSLFASDSLTSSSIGLSVSSFDPHSSLTASAAASLELPPFPVFFEPLAILERQHKLPKPADAESSNGKVSSSDGSHAMHMAYTFDELASCLLVALMDERGCIVHSTVLPASSLPMATAEEDAKGASLDLLHRLLARFFTEHLRPLLLILPRTMYVTRVRLVVAKLGTPLDESDRRAWSSLCHEWRFHGAFANASPMPCPSIQPAASPQVGSATIEDVFLLSVLPAPSSAATPPHAPTANALLLTSPAKSTPETPFDLDAELARAKQSFASTVGSKAWWQARAPVAPTALPMSLPDDDGNADAASSASSFASRLYVASAPLSTSTQRVTTKQAAQLASIDASTPTARVRLAGYFTPASRSGLGSASDSSCRSCTRVVPSVSFCHTALLAILAQWAALARLYQIDADPSAFRRAHRWTGEPVPHLPMHLTVLTRLHAMLDAL